MPRDYADALAHQSIPEEFLECLLTRRHSFPMGQAKRQYVRVQFGPRKTDVLDQVEYAGTCERCGTQRLIRRERHGNAYLWSEYTRPEGYDPPAGLLWDRDALWAEYYRRHPIKGKVRLINQS